MADMVFAPNFKRRPNRLTRIVGGYEIEARLRVVRAKRVLSIMGPQHGSIDSTSTHSVRHICQETIAAIASVLVIGLHAILMPDSLVRRDVTQVVHDFYVAKVRVRVHAISSSNAGGDVILVDYSESGTAYRPRRQEVRRWSRMGTNS